MNPERTLTSGAAAETELAIMGETDLDALENLADVPIELKAELDRRTMPLRELLALATGTVVPFFRPAGENVDIYAGEVPIGTGEILVVESGIAIRIADLRNDTAETSLAGAPRNVAA